jgi:hypothetical protein
MILREQIEVPVLPAAVLHRLISYLSDVTPEGASSEATQDQRSSHVRAGFAFLSKQVLVQTLEPTVTGARTIVPVRWTATGITGPLFPTLDANIELRQTACGTEIALVGSYLPPMGALGAAVDRLVLHELATATVGNFLGRIAARVTLPEEAQNDEWAPYEQTIPGSA